MCFSYRRQYEIEKHLQLEFSLMMSFLQSSTNILYTLQKYFHNYDISLCLSCKNLSNLLNIFTKNVQAE